MTDISKILDDATDALYVSLSGKAVTITPADTDRLRDRVRTEVVKLGYDKPFEIEISLDDDAEFIDVTMKAEGKTETVGLNYVDMQGRLLVRVDTDGDGK